LVRGAIKSLDDGLLLVPKEPEIFIDRRYILAGMGLLSGCVPTAAVRILKKELGL
jgi:hypothetical protein